MDILSFELWLGLCIIWLTLRYYLTRNFDYWKTRNVPGPEPIPLLGTLKDVFFGKIHVADYLKFIYDSYPDEPAVGLFFRSTPILLMKHPDMIKDVLIGSFSTFPSRGIKIHADIEPLSQHLIFLEYKRWKPLRKRLTPIFTSGKLKDMFDQINKCADDFIYYLNELVSKGEPIECRELTAKFTTDVIGVCAFGLNMNAMTYENNEFRKIGRFVCADTWINRLKLFSRTLPHWVAVFLKPIIQNKKVINFFVATVKSTMDHRKKYNIRRPDLIDLLMNMRDRPEHIEGMSDTLLTAQAFVFFLAGFETSASTMSNAMLELALNSDVQKRLREEVKAAFGQNDGKLNYDVLKNMKYLDQVFQETLRKYPPVFALPREASNDYTFAHRNISITKGTKVLIPIYAVHHDPKIYPDPDKFDPNRFEEQANYSRPPMSFLPFGAGPRNCFGERFAHNQTKLGLANIISQFELQVCHKTCKTYEKQLGSLLLTPKKGLYLRFKKL